MVSKLSGRIDQLTIFGEIEFIPNKDYGVKSELDLIIISGEFKIVGSDEIEQLEIKMTKEQYIKHLN